MTSEKLKAPFPWFGGKSGVTEKVWRLFGDVTNYVEPFVGSAAMLLGSPKIYSVETINDFDGFISNFWRAVSKDPSAVVSYLDWPVNETDLLARHLWLVNHRDKLTKKLIANPDWYSARAAGWWCWGLCSWIGSGWCLGDGPWVLGDDGELVNRRKLPHVSNAGRGVNRSIPHVSNAGQGVNRSIPHVSNAGRGVNRTQFLLDWLHRLQERLRDVRVTSGDWSRVVKDSVTTRHGLTAVFLDPPYEKGAMDYGVESMNKGVASDVRDWCIENTGNKKLRIILCGHSGEHDELLKHGWFTVAWEARKGYAVSEEAVQNSKSETLWCSPNCIREKPKKGLFDKNL